MDLFERSFHCCVVLVMETDHEEGLVLSRGYSASPPSTRTFKRLQRILKGIYIQLVETEEAAASHTNQEVSFLNQPPPHISIQKN